MNLPGIIRLVSTLVLIAMFALPTSAQRGLRALFDTNYIKRYDTMITTRTFLSRKYLALELEDLDTAFKLKYRPNSKVKLGVGMSYGAATVNVGVQIGRIGPDARGKGELKATDLQVHIYTPKITFDLFGQYYKGMFLLSPKTVTVNGHRWYVRPDISMWQAGGAALYSFNWRRFSYRAAFRQTDWQVKSAGSVLMGAQFFFEKADADSAFVPSLSRSSFRTAGVNKVLAGDLGPALGYAYTFVLARHFFLSGSAIGCLSLNLLREEGQGLHHTYFRFTPNYALKGAIGYNSPRFTASMTWVHNSIIASGSNTDYTFQAGLARFQAAYRFQPGPRFKKAFRIAIR